MLLCKAHLCYHLRTSKNNFIDSVSTNVHATPIKLSIKFLMTATGKSKSLLSTFTFLWFYFTPHKVWYCIYLSKTITRLSCIHISMHVLFICKTQPFNHACPNSPDDFNKFTIHNKICCVRLPGSNLCRLHVDHVQLYQFQDLPLCPEENIACHHLGLPAKNHAWNVSLKHG